MISGPKPTQRSILAPERCSTTTYAWCGALGSTQAMREEALCGAAGGEPHVTGTSDASASASATQPLRIPEPCSGRLSPGSKACGQAPIPGLFGHRHCKGEAVRGKGQREVVGRKAGPGSAAHAPVALALAERLQETIQIRMLAVNHRLDVARARVVLRVIGGGDDRERFRVP